MNDKTTKPVGKLERTEFQVYYARLMERFERTNAKVQKAEQTLDSIRAELHLLILKVYELECEVARLKQKKNN